MTKDEKYFVSLAHNAIFLKSLGNSITALSLPLIADSANMRWASMYVVNNKPTQIEGI